MTCEQADLDRDQRALPTIAGLRRLTRSLAEVELDALAFDLAEIGYPDPGPGQARRGE